MMHHLLVLAASGGGGADLGSFDVTTLLGPILSTGIVGVILVMITLEVGFITKKSADREREAAEKAHEDAIKAKDDVIQRQQDDLDELKKTNGSLQALTQDKLLPILVQATDVQRAYVAELARRNYRRDDDS